MLEIKNVSKSFGGHIAVTNESFTVDRGQILGLIGQNGAGKTTTFRMILDFLDPDRGTITWNGRPISQMNRDYIGYLPEERGLYPKMTVEEQILFFGQLHGMKRKQVFSQLDDWMERFQVKGSRKDKVKNLSKGNQQKVQLIAALIFMPKLAILDEPFSGLDPVNASLLKDGIRYLQQNGTAIIFSSHDMTNVESLSDHLVMLRDGAVVLNGTLSEVRNSYGDTRIYIRKEGLVKEQLQSLSGVREVNQNGDRFEVEITDSNVGPEVFKAVTQDGFVKEFSQQPPTLDEIFRMKVGDRNA